MASSSKPHSGDSRRADHSAQSGDTELASKRSKLFLKGKLPFSFASRSSSRTDLRSSPAPSIHSVGSAKTDRQLSAHHSNLSLNSNASTVKSGNAPPPASERPSLASRLRRTLSDNASADTAPTPAEKTPTSESQQTITDANPQSSFKKVSTLFPELRWSERSSPSNSRPDSPASSPSNSETSPANLSVSSQSASRNSSVSAPGGIQTGQQLDTIANAPGDIATGAVAVPAHPARFRTLNSEYELNSNGTSPPGLKRADSMPTSPLDTSNVSFNDSSKHNSSDAQGYSPTNKPADSRGREKSIVSTLSNFSTESRKSAVNSYGDFAAPNITRSDTTFDPRHTKNSAQRQPSHHHKSRILSKVFGGAKDADGASRKKQRTKNTDIIAERSSANSISSQSSQGSKGFRFGSNSDKRPSTSSSNLSSRRPSATSTIPQSELTALTALTARSNASHATAGRGYSTADQGSGSSSLRKSSTMPSSSIFDQASRWQAPESWESVPGNPNPISRATTSSFPSSSLSHEDSQAPATPSVVLNPEAERLAPKPKQNYFFRVFKDDGTFVTLSCALDITVSEIIQLLGRKSFLSSVVGYELSVTSGGLKKIMLPTETPLLWQRKLLELMGYQDKDKLAELGRDDLSYLCKFKFSKTNFRHFGAEDLRNGELGNYEKVDLSHCDLQTIPVMLYKESTEIQQLNISENPSINVPLDFVQACCKLFSLSMASNRLLHFPANLNHATHLKILDISHNLIQDLSEIAFDSMPLLEHFNARGNAIIEIPDSLTRLHNLKSLNLGSNRISVLNPKIANCESLTVLHLSFNHLQDLPEELGALKNLERLTLNNNALAGEIPPLFNRLKELSHLDIRFNKFTNINDLIDNCPNLKTLLATRNEVGLVDVKGSNSLTTVNLNKNPLSRIVPHAVVFNNLININLSRAKLNKLPHTFFKAVSQADTLILDRNDLVQLPPSISLLTRLTCLSVFGNKLVSIPTELCSLPELQQLDLHSNNIKSLPAELWNLHLFALNVSSNLLESFPVHHIHVNTNKDDQKRVKDELSSSITEIDKEDNRGYKALSRHNSSKNLQNSDAEKHICLSDTLVTLSIADNLLGDDCFESLSMLTNLTLLNISYNRISNVGSGLRNLTELSELYMSGNSLTNLTDEDIEVCKKLRVLHLNGNKLATLPAELGSIKSLRVLDVGSNKLKYNTRNWPYEWNWNYNENLTYLSFSGNKRFEIKYHDTRALDPTDKNLSDFTSLPNLRTLGLMDVTVTTALVPDQTEDCRVRSYGSRVLSMPYGLADYLGSHRSHLSIIDLVIERFRGSDKECIVGFFDGRNEKKGNKVAKLIQETFGPKLQEELSKLADDETTHDALRRAFLNVNKDIGNICMLPKDDGSRSAIAHRLSTAAQLDENDLTTGSCATIIYINDHKMYVANVGDTMAILARENGDTSLLTTKHDPTMQHELNRIRLGAGAVSTQGKLDDKSDVSRAIGLYNLIPHINADPSISETDLSDNDDLVIVASKQLWERIPYDVAAEIARSESDDLMMAAHRLRDYAIAYGCGDKIMVMVLGVGDVKSKRKAKLMKGVSSQGDEEYRVGRVRKDKSAPVDPPVGELAMVFTDIKSSTLLWELNSQAMTAAWREHNNIMRQRLGFTRGYEVKTEGDAFMVTFPSATSALLWCFTVQLQLLQAVWYQEFIEQGQGIDVFDKNGQLLFKGLSVRMGIHWGEPQYERDPITRRMDYFGPMVNKASRISGIAGGGQITVSADYLDELKRVFAAYDRDPVAFAKEYEGEPTVSEIQQLRKIGYEIREIGERKLKGLENPEFISAIYPKSLIGRFEYHKSSGGDSSSRPQRKSKPIKSADDAEEIITIDQIMLVRSVAMRLELIVSRLEPGMPVYNSTLRNEEQAKYPLLNQASELYDYDPVELLEHFVTRVESAVGSLQMRLTMTNMAPDSRHLSLFDLIDEYVGALRMMKEMKGGIQIAEEKKRRRSSVTPMRRLQIAPYPPPPPRASKSYWTQSKDTFAFG